MSFELKPYQRVKTRNGREGILVANPLNGSGVAHTKAPLVSVLHATDGYTNGYMPGEMVYAHDNPEWDVVAVWESPNYYGDLLDFTRRGDIVWAEKPQDVLQAEADVESAKVLLASAEDRLKAALEAAAEAHK